MSVHIQFGGDPTGPNDQVRQVLEKRFDSRQFLGLVEVNLHYNAGRGYQVTRATLMVPSVGSGPEVPAPRPIEDYTAQVLSVLKEGGVQLA